jgi:hypothetical protein
LQQFVGQDLRNLDNAEKARLEAVLAGCIPEWTNHDGFLDAEPWFLWTHPGADGRPGYILFEGCHLFVIPGASSAVVHFLAADGRYLSSTRFSTGWRINIQDASFRSDPTLGVPVIEVSSTASINGADIRRQVYGVFGDRVALLRLEDGDGELVVNCYQYPNCTIGPPAPPWPPEDWEWALRVGGPARALEALTWIGGVHRTGPEPPPPNAWLEDAGSVQRLAEVRQRPETRRAIRRLTQSQNQWIKEAARAALRKLGENPDDA